MTWADVVRTDSVSGNAVNENAAPGNAALTSASYPELFKLVPQAEPKQQARCISEQQSQQVPMSPPSEPSPANISRRRQAVSSRLDTLTNTPPRVSHMQRITDIFNGVASSPAPIRKLPEAKAAYVTPIHEAAIRSVLRYYDIMKFDPETECRLSGCEKAVGHFGGANCRASSPAPHLLRGSPPPSPADSVTAGSHRLVSAARSRHSSVPSTPVSWRASRSLNPTASPLPLSSADLGTQQLIDPADLSSDEWTGDEDFFPRSARSRRRQQRIDEKIQQAPPGGTSAQAKPAQKSAQPDVGPMSSAFHEQLLASRSPRASRFQSFKHPLTVPTQSRTPSGGFRYGTMTKPVYTDVRDVANIRRQSEDNSNGSSDADDEQSSSSS